MRHSAHASARHSPQAPFCQLFPIFSAQLSQSLDPGTLPFNGSAATGSRKCTDAVASHWLVAPPKNRQSHNPSALSTNKVHCDRCPSGINTNPQKPAHRSGAMPLDARFQLIRQLHNVAPAQSRSVARYSPAAVRALPSRQGNDALLFPEPAPRAFS